MSTTSPVVLAEQRVAADFASSVPRHGRLAAGSLRWPATRRRRRPPADRLVLLRLSTGSLERNCLDDHVTATAGDVFLVAYPGLAYSLRSSCGAAGDVVILDHPRRSVTSLTPTTASDAQLCRDVIDYVVHGVFANPVASADSLTVRDASRLVERCLDTAFGAERLTDSNSTLSLALDYLEDHLGDDLTVADIAGACNLSVRGLQTLFRNRLGTTPMACLREARLRRVHEELRASDSAATVSAVAACWGLSHYGRFAAAYRERYGESPQETLVRSGPGAEQLIEVDGSGAGWDVQDSDVWPGD